MDIRFYFWIFLGMVSYESPYRDFVAIIASVIYIYGSVFRGDMAGVVFGANCIGMWYLLFTRFDYNVFLVGIWIILVSLNYLLVKLLWKGIDQ